MLGFFIAFAVKLPMIPFHTWLADAHTQAPTAGSVILAGLKTGAGLHGISTGALFILVGALQQRMHTRELDSMGGLWATVPRLSGAALFFALASLGLPGLGDFIGEFLVMIGTYR